ncbi:RusA family crossover junction endodeoxyribonuclease [Methylobacterium brachythecii]|uniref:Holliday junction resolvase RusA-like endonuclease n=1 Tax=Methylobacterium brachythecii TaxID=1176177 RepID=A0A7W6AM07_9HYPH|nr:RusA family crossover junction endodeoxyribonuclease [Methylobacterium brachythecii]MBB3905098.1 Holliday junction resolvase RusA-like endonuclease [Methylobacterium brachythecii]GLS44394.1 hypothetical protein GCM10007884_23820 [Methylobacterium brachythecii]
MSDRITIVLEGPPRGKGRHRTRVVAMPGRAPFAQEYPDPKTKQYEAALSGVAKAEMIGREPLSGPLRVVVFAFMPIPASWSKSQKREARNRIIRPVTKPDWDNLGKVCDALNGIVWGDDAAVVSGQVEKYYSDEPELVVTVEPWVPVIVSAAAEQVAA